VEPEKAVSHSQDWSDPDRAIEEIERATAEREEAAKNTEWFKKLVKPSSFFAGRGKRNKPRGNKPTED
jgi:hypothetical protein